MVKQELQKIIGQNLYRIRTEQNLTREALAEKVGISATFYANLECGNKMMSMITLRKLTDALSVSADSLLYEDRPNKRITSIQMLLQDQPDHIVAFVETLVRLCVSDFPKDGSSITEEGVAVRDECGV